MFLRDSAERWALGRVSCFVEANPSPGLAVVVDEIENIHVAAGKAHRHAMGCAAWKICPIEDIVASAVWSETMSAGSVVVLQPAAVEFAIARG